MNTAATKHVTHELEPADVFSIFEEISQISRPTGNPKNQSEIICYIKDTLESHGIATQKDEAGNLYAYKNATSGCENAPGLLLQAHVDMVCAPDENIFPLKLVVEEGYLHADGTSCGLDNGMGVALAMSILINSPQNHGKLEAAFTLNEDTDCYGAINMKGGYVTADYMISLDDESWGKICIGSAGAEAYTYTLPYQSEPLSDNMKCLKINVSGLCGGHSGYSIDKGQANANMICASLLSSLFVNIEGINLRLVSIDGGVADNAIPFESEMIVAVENDKLGDVMECVANVEKIFADKYAVTDPNLTIQCEIADNCCCSLSAEKSRLFAECIKNVQNGPLVFHENEDGTREIQTSSNLAIVKTDVDKITVRTLTRSSVEAEMYRTLRDIHDVIRLYSDDVTIVNHSSALCWEPDWKSTFLKTAKDVFKKQNGREPEIYAPHCYMEGAYFAKIHGVLPIALGPQIDGAHTVGERVRIDTVGKCRKLVVGIIEEIAR